MDISFYYNDSENNKIHKNIQLISTLTGTLRNTSNIVRPEITIASDVTNSNYAYIPDFKRYYYIRDIVSVRNEIWTVMLESDPLMSFESSIMNLQVVLAETEQQYTDSYLADSRVWITKVKDKTDIINFPSGLLQDGEFILITAGG